MEELRKSSDTLQSISEQEQKLLNDMMVMVERLVEKPGGFSQEMNSQWYAMAQAWKEGDMAAYNKLSDGLSYMGVEHDKALESMKPKDDAMLLKELAELKAPSITEIESILAYARGIKN